MSLINLSPSQLRRAADLKEKIEALQDELNSLQGGSAEITSATPAKKVGKRGGKRKFTAAGLERIREAQKLRWAKAQDNSSAEKPTVRRTHKMSAAGRAKIKAAQKARWAKFHAENPAK